MDYDTILLNCEEAMQKGLDHLVKEYRTVRTGRASPALVENLQVEYYGSMTPLKQMANISAQDATSLVIKPFDASQVQAISKAIMEANIGLNPQDDGAQIRINLPAMTEETRKKLVSTVKDMSEQCKVTIRNARQDANKSADAAHKDSTLTEDDHRGLRDEIQGLTDKFNKLIEAELDKKSKDVMSV